MRADLRCIAEKLALGTTLASLGYAAFALVRLRAFGRDLRAPQPAPARRPHITVLKPVCGDEPALEENLASFCAQDYPHYDVVFGVLSADDSGLDAIRRVAAAAPDRTAVVVGDGVARLRNPKMSNVAPMLAHARGEILAISDSDMHVTPEYLDALAAAFADPQVGAVTALYRGDPADGTLANVLGAMLFTEQFTPSALVALAIEPVRFIFGATMAVRRDVLAEIGGIEELGGYLADDYALGRLVTEKGHLVAVARFVVTNVVAERDLQALLEHEVRWARTIRAVRPLNYLGILLTYPLPLALGYLALARRKRFALALTAAAALVRLTIHDAAHRALGSRSRPALRLIPLRDALGVVVWALGLRGRTVRWRETVLHVADEAPQMRNRAAD